MQPSHFVSQIKKIAIDEGLESYKEIFNTKDNVTDKYYIKAIKFFNNLDTESKQTFFEIIRAVEVDTVSTMLGILDSAIWLEDQENDFILTMENSKSIINGDLQDMFLEEEENNSSNILFV